MSKPQDRSVYRRKDEMWVNRRNDASRATNLHNSQKEADQAARKNLRNQGGGELSLHSENGQIRSKDTIKPGNDPNPPKDKEH